MTDAEEEGAPFRVGAFVLTPIARVVVQGVRGEAGVVVHASKRPVALRIAGPDGERVVRLDED